MSALVSRSRAIYRLSVTPRPGFVHFCNPTDNESGAECEREKEEDRSQQKDRVPQLVYHWTISFLRLDCRGDERKGVDHQSSANTLGSARGSCKSVCCEARKVVITWSSELNQQVERTESLGVKTRLASQRASLAPENVGQCEGGQNANQP